MQRGRRALQHCLKRSKLIENARGNVTGATWMAFCDHKLYICYTNVHVIRSSSSDLHVLQASSRQRKTIFCQPTQLSRGSEYTMNGMDIQFGLNSSRASKFGSAEGRTMNRTSMAHQARMPGGHS